MDIANHPHFSLWRGQKFWQKLLAPITRAYQSYADFFAHSVTGIL
jgi:hypothetical protein